MYKLKPLSSFYPQKMSKSVTYDTMGQRAIPIETETKDSNFPEKDELSPPPIEGAPPAYAPMPFNFVRKNHIEDSVEKPAKKRICPRIECPKIECPEITCPKIVCPKITCPNLECTTTNIAIFIAILCTLAILFGILFGVILKNIEDRDHFVDTECRSLNLNSTIYRCCNVLDCSCTECGSSNPVCDNGVLINQPQNRSSCCGKSECCRTCCSRCCDESCTGTGNDRRCTSQCYDCNCYCCHEVSHRTCSFACGMCTDYSILYRVDATDKIKTQIEKCGRDDMKCTTNIVQKYSRDKVWGCSYDKTDPDRVRFTGGIPGLNIAAIVFFSLFGVVFLVLLGLFVVSCVRENCK